MKNKLPFKYVLIAATILACGPILAAQDEDLAAPPAAEQDNNLELEQTKDASNTQNPPLITGGVGEEDMARMKAAQSEYNFKLLITEKNGTFLSDIAVHIEDKKGNAIADVQTEGPILLAKLPPGKYKVTATRHDEVKTFAVSVASKGLSAHLISFKDTDERLSGNPRSTPLK